MLLISTVKMRRSRSSKWEQTQNVAKRSQWKYLTTQCKFVTNRRKKNLDVIILMLVTHCVSIMCSHGYQLIYSSKLCEQSVTDFNPVFPVLRSRGTTGRHIPLHKVEMS